jgi:hypothetical protein
VTLPISRPAVPFNRNVSSIPLVVTRQSSLLQTKFLEMDADSFHPPPRVMAVTYRAIAQSIGDELKHRCEPPSELSPQLTDLVVQLEHRQPSGACFGRVQIKEVPDGDQPIRDK